MSVPLSVVVFHLFYWSSSVGAETTAIPRYYSEAMPFFWILAAAGLLHFCSTRKRIIFTIVLLPLLTAWNVNFSTLPRLKRGKNLYNISRQDLEHIQSEAAPGSLVFVEARYWTDFASLSWSNAATLDGDYVFARRRTPRSQALLRRQFADRKVYYYDRQAIRQLEEAPAHPISPPPPDPSISLPPPP